MADITLVATMDTSGIQRGEKTINQSAVAVSRAVARADTEFARLDRQLKQNKISLDQHSQATRKVTKDLAAFKAGQSEVGNMFNNIERQLVGNTRSMSNFGVGVQQAGYQVGDFLVQIQGGTNAFVAFGQQATQLVGILPMFNPALVGLSAGLGIAIPLVTAIGAYFSRAGDTAGAMEDQIKNLESAVRDYASALEASRDITGHLRDEFGVTSNILRQLVQDFEELARIKVFDEIGSKVAALRTTHLEGFESDLENIKDLLRLEGLFAAAGQEVAQFDGLLKTVENDAVDLGDRIAAAMSLRDILLENSGGIKNMTADQKAFYNDLVRIIQQMDVFREQQKETSASLRTQISHQQQIATIQDQVNAARKQLRDSYNSEEKSLQQQIDLSKEILNYGKNSSQVEALRAQHARDNYQESLREDGIKGNLLNTLMSMYDESVKLKGEQKDVADEAERFSTILDMADLSHLVDQSASLATNMASAADNAAAALAARTLDVANASNVAYAGRGTTSSRPAFQMDDQGRVTTVSQILSEQERARKKKRSGSKKQTPGEKADDYLRKLELEAKYKESIIGLSEREARVQEIIKELKQKELPIDEKRIQNLVDMEEKVRKLTEAEQQREQLMQTVTSNIESAFMSVVDGSKSVEDAFRGMLRNIILAVYQQQVAQPAATAIGNLAGKIFNFDGGGFTGYGSRSGGLDGKGGMMAMVHPNETVIDHTKGQSMGSVQVVNNFNIAANGDDSVKRIIRSEIPRITEATKAAVVDAKRRGGSYGRSF